MDHGGCKLRYWDETYRHTTDIHLTHNSWISLNQSSHRIRGWWSSGCSPELVGSSAPKPWGYVSLLFVTFKLSIIFHPNWNGTSILLFNIFADTAVSFIHTFRVGGVDPDEFDRVWGSSDIWYSNSRIIGPWSIQIVLICFALFCYCPYVVSDVWSALFFFCEKHSHLPQGVRSFRSTWGAES